MGNAGKDASFLEEALKAEIERLAVQLVRHGDLAIIVAQRQIARQILFDCELVVLIIQRQIDNAEAANRQLADNRVLPKREPAGKAVCGFD